MFYPLSKSFGAQAGLSRNFWLCLSALCVGLVFGGGSRQGLPSEFVCQFMGTIFLAVALAELLSKSEGARRVWPELALAAMIVVVPLLQIIPLPAFLWSALPGRSALVKEFMVARGSLPWEPLSMSSEATHQAIFSLLCPMAVFVSSLLLNYEERRVVSVSILAFGGLSVAVALLQLVGGANSPLRFYAITNVNLPVGFFANRNHFAAFLYSLLPITAAWMVALGMKVGKSKRKSEPNHKTQLGYVSAAAVFIAILLVQGLVHSRAGLILSFLSTGLSFCLLLPFRKTEAGAKLFRSMFGVLILAVVVMSFYGAYTLLQQVDHDPIEDARFTILTGALKALWSFFPVGSGVGTFDQVYRAFEIPSSATSEYINRAHDDIVETLIEGGIFSAVVLGIFVAWLSRSSWRVWNSESPGVSPIDNSLARAGAFVPLLLIFHSFLDYPLRTEAVMSLAAFCCALTVEPINNSPMASSRRRRSSRTSSVYVPSADRTAT